MDRFTVKTGVLAAGALLLLVACKFLLSTTSSPFAWIGFILFVAGIFLCVTLRTPLLRNTALIMAFLALPLAIIELYLGWKSPTSEVIYTPDGANYQPSDILGYAPKPATLITAKRTYAGELIYDVEYRINRSGMRHTPASATHSTKACILFFGGSFTFGEGLNDTDTVANYVAHMDSNKARVFNFGYSGYGPQQMLAAIDQGLVSKLAGSCTKVTAVYTGVTQHIARVAGYSWWDLHGPKYTLDKNGAAQYTGHFDDGLQKQVQSLRSYALKSHIFSLLFSLRLNGYYSEANIKLYAAIVAAAGDALRAQFGADTVFKVILWHPDFFGEHAQSYTKAVAALEKSGIPVHSIDATVLPGPDLEKYKIHRHEGHPNAMTNRKVAAFVVDMLKP